MGATTQPLHHTLPLLSPSKRIPNPKRYKKTSGTKPLVFLISRNIHFFSAAR